MADNQPAQQQTFENNEILQVDDGDEDSALGVNFADSTASLTSSILRYRTIHGRTYHSERGNSQYW